MTERDQDSKKARPAPPDSTKGAAGADAPPPPRLAARLRELGLQFAKAVGPGVIATALALWGIGSFNNSLALALSTDRQASATDPSSGDTVRLSMQLKKTGSTRIRLVDCKVQLSSHDASAAQQEQLRAAAAAASKSLTEDFRISTGNGVALVPQDEVQFQAAVGVPEGITVHAKVIITTRQYVMEFLQIADPNWSSSVVVLPAAGR